MPERTPGSGSRAPTWQGCARACASQPIDSVTVLHLKDLVQGFWQNTALSWWTARFRTSGTAGEPRQGARHRLLQLPSASLVDQGQCTCCLHALAGAHADGVRGSL